MTARLRARRIRLRTRLVALVVGLLVVAFAAVAAVTVVLLHHFLQSRLDQQLRAAGARFSVGLEHPNDHDADNDQQFETVAGQAVGTLGARILDGRVTAAAVVGRHDDVTSPGSAARAAIGRLRHTASPTSIDLEGLGDYRVLVTPGDDGDLLVTGLPTHGVDETIGRLVAIEAAVFGVALVAAAVVGAVFVRITLRPLDRMAETATSVADLPLSTGEVSLPPRAATVEDHTEIGALNGAFNHMLDHVESSLRRRQDSEDRLRKFVADASHELRTPVAVVRSRAEQALRAEVPPSGDVEHSLRRIEAESGRMGRLVDDLLTLARVDTGREFAHDEVDLTRLLLDAVDDARIAGPDHRWQLDLPEEPVVVTGDEGALGQVLANLLTNARTHTPAGTTVVAAVRSQADDGAQVDVLDDGPGIPGEALSTIFERFVRADRARSTTSGGSGLGLAIVDAIVRRHGGTVEVASEPGATRFTVRLPADGDRQA